MRRIAPAFLGSLLLLGCAGPLESTPDTNRRASGSAARIYTIAESQRSQGNYANAVLLLRHAILQLREGKESDALRHKLILRMAYVELLAFDATGDRQFAKDAEKMLNLYVAKHTALFGETQTAKAERGQVYELLYEVETALEGDVDDDGEPSEARPDPTGSEGTRVAASDSPRDIDSHAGEDLDDRMQRDVRVRKRRLAQPDDERVMARLRSDYSDGMKAGVLTEGGTALLHGPRAQVRANRLPHNVEDDATLEERRVARKLGFQLLRSIRPDLRSCYAAAFARQPVAVTRSVVEASIDAEGRVAQPRIVGGGVVDGLGDVCLLEQLEKAQLVAEAERPAVRIRLPLIFFYDGAAAVSEGRQPSVDPPQFTRQFAAPRAR